MSSVSPWLKFVKVYGLFLSERVELQVCLLGLKVAVDSMAVRDLSTVVKPDDIISTDHLITLLVVVSKYAQKDWLANYERLSTFVVCSKLQNLEALTRQPF